MGEKMVQYNILKRDADANKQLYDGLQQKMKEATHRNWIAVFQYSCCGSCDDSRLAIAPKPAA